MRQLVEAARVAGAVHVASCDQHELSDPEISQAPDYEATWPPHCLLGTRGAEKIVETRQLDPLPLPLVPVPRATLVPLLDGLREFLIPKKQYDPFTNPNTETLLDVLDPAEVILFGVATDICDAAAICALLRRSRRVMFVEDAGRRGRSRLRDRRRGGRLARLRDTPLAADENPRWWGTGSMLRRTSPRPGFRWRSSCSSS
jgi:nicotinamidase/pyrazinamidase